MLKVKYVTPEMSAIQPHTVVLGRSEAAGRRERREKVKEKRLQRRERLRRD